MIRPGGILLLLLVSVPALAQDEAVWAGHQVVHGETDVPIIGKIKTRAESTFLARVEKHGNILSITQEACSFDFKETMGVKVRLPSNAITNLPPAQIQFGVQGDRADAVPWVVAWDTEDVDEDGKPGVTVFVDSTLCGGELQVASASTSMASASLDKDGMRGSIRVRVIQEILDTSGICLALFSSDTDEVQAGTFAYLPVPPQSTCESLQRDGWPVDAEQEAKAPKDNG